MGIHATRRGLLKLGFLLLPMPLCAQARRHPLGVVELFTSQGCVSCPPADALMVELAERGDIIALSYHVDYWDYLGWKDHLATPENTARQRGYGELLDTAVYTPQAVVNGRRNVIGSDREALLAALSKGRGAEGLTTDVALFYVDHSVVIDIAAAREPVSAHVVLVYFKPQMIIEIQGGENKGRTIDYRNIVTSLQTVGIWHGKPMRLELPKSEMAKKGGRCAVLLQIVDEAGRPGPILGAAQSAPSDADAR